MPIADRHSDPGALDKPPGPSATPLVSALILIMCGYASTSLVIVIGGGLIVAAGMISATGNA